MNDQYRNEMIEPRVHRPILDSVYSLIFQQIISRI